MANSLKIGLVFDDSLDSNDGVQQYVRTLGRYLLEAGHEVRFLVGQTSQAGDLQPYVHSLSRNISVHGNQNKMFLPFFARGSDIDAVMRTEKFDVLHVMTPYSPIMGQRVVARAGNAALVSHFHMVGGTWLVNTGSKILATMQRKSLSSFDMYLGVSEATTVYAKRYFGIDLQVSPNPVELQQFLKGSPKPYLRAERGTIIFLGRLVERKGAFHLLKAVQELHTRKQLDGLLFHFCGDGELRTELESFATAHGLNNNVIFHGFIDEAEKADFLASADLAIYPSTGGEAFGIVLTEAMATGHPVVLAGDNPGYRTVLGERPDQLFDPHNTPLLADKILEFIRDTKKIKSAREWQNQAVRRYDIQTVGPEVVQLYRQAIEHRRKKNR